MIAHQVTLSGILTEDWWQRQRRQGWYWRKHVDDLEGLFRNPSEIPTCGTVQQLNSCRSYRRWSLRSLQMFSQAWMSCCTREGKSGLISPENPSHSVSTSLSWDHKTPFTPFPPSHFTLPSLSLSHQSPLNQLPLTLSANVSSLHHLTPHQRPCRQLAAHWRHRWGAGGGAGEGGGEEEEEEKVPGWWWWWVPQRGARDPAHTHPLLPRQLTIQHCPPPAGSVSQILRKHFPIRFKHNARCNDIARGLSTQQIWAMGTR